MATSPHARCILGLNPVVLGVVISPEQKKPKKHRSAAAQIMITSGSVARGSKVDRMARRMAGVIGSLVRLGFDVCSRWVRWIPAWTRRRRGNEENERGSGRPRVTCVCRMPDKYVLMDCGDTF